MNENIKIIESVLNAAIKSGLINDLESAKKIAEAWSKIKEIIKNS